MLLFQANPRSLHLGSVDVAAMERLKEEELAEERRETRKEQQRRREDNERLRKSEPTVVSSLQSFSDESGNDDDDDDDDDDPSFQPSSSQYVKKKPDFINLKLPVKSFVKGFSQISDRHQASLRHRCDAVSFVVEHGGGDVADLPNSIQSWKT